MTNAPNLTVPKGSGIQVFGVYPNGADFISVDFTIDGSNTASREVPGLSTGGPLGNQVLFEAFGFDDEAHEIRINNINASQDRPFIVQGFNLFTKPAVEKPKPNTNLKVKISVSVVGGLVFILLILFVLLRVRRRRLRQLHRTSKFIIEGTLPTSPSK